MRGRRPYAWGHDHPLALDALVAGTMAVVGLMGEATAHEPGLRDASPLSAALVLGTALPLVLRRRRPLATYGLVAALAFVYFTREYPGAGPVLALLVGLYGTAAYARRRAAIGVLAGTLLVLGVALAGDGTPLVESLGFLGMFLAVWILGDTLRVRRAYVAAVEDRAAHLEREREALAERAVLQERSRIARELHDVVAHSMSVMVVQAGAARRTVTRDPARAAEAVGHIETTGRGALEEMRRLVGVLRDGAGPPSADGPLGPQPGVGQVAELVEQCRGAGLDVTLRVEGDERPLPSGIELVVYRIVQEALTNTMRHAGPARAEVVLRYGEDEVAVSVTDDGRGAAAPEPDAAPGHGLTGMRERVALYGGDLAVGPRAGGGFQVRASLPLAPAVSTG